MFLISDKKGKNLEDVQRMNRLLIINFLRKQKNMSRADLARATGLKQATITNIVNDLLDTRLARETGELDAKIGRRSIGIALNNELYKVIHVRLARKYFLIGLYDIAGNKYEVHKENIDISWGSETVFTRMKVRIAEQLSRLKIGEVISIGISLPGPYLSSQGRIGIMTEFPGWEKISIKDEIQSYFGIPTYAEHDANVGALAEWWLGSNFMDKGTLVYVAAGQGIGTGIINDGKLFKGAMGIAGEVGHMSIAFDGPKCQCGNRGCLEYYCSTFALLREAKKQAANHNESMLTQDVDLNDFFKALESGDFIAKRVFGHIARFLGLGLVNIVNIYNPHVIVVGDELARGGEYLLEILKQTVKEHVLPMVYEQLTIRLSAFDDDPALIGAGSLAVNNINDIIFPA